VPIEVRAGCGLSADKLAGEISNNHYRINIIDVRSPEEYKAYHIPLAINIPLAEIMDRKWERIFKQQIKSNYFYADNDTTVKKACLLAKHVGKSENFILHESASEFRALFQDPKMPGVDAGKNEFNIYHFRAKASHDMKNLEESLKNLNQPVVQKAVVVKGGC
jgi:rhodanese-related sulfurtransferase